MNTSGSPSAPFVNEIRVAKYISFVSTRKNGTPIATPVWVAPLDYLGPNVVGFTIDANAGKAKRLAHTNTVTVQPCDIRGRTVEGSPTKCFRSTYGSLNVSGKAKTNPKLPSSSR